MNDSILLAHGAGGTLSHDLVEGFFLPVLSNPILSSLEDSAVFDLQGRLAFTTDSYVVTPLFFPGGDIGRLAVCGTVNDLSMSGATPLYLSLSLIIEEGFPFDDLKRIMASIQEAAQEAGVRVVTGDTKVVHRGKADGLFINTAGIGLVPEGLDISASHARPGDHILLSGPIGDHGMAVLSLREGLEFRSSIESDCAPLNWLVAEMLDVSREIRCLRDPTRGGLATTLNEFAIRSKVGIRIEEEKVPINDGVRGACEFLGLDPFYVANEGKLVAVVSPEDSARLLVRMRGNQYASRAALIGEVVADHPKRVVIATPFGTHRILPMPAGELLPRIC